MDDIEIDDNISVKSEIDDTDYKNNSNKDDLDEKDIESNYEEEEENVIVLSDIETSDSENDDNNELKFNENKNIVEINFDKKKHLQFLTLNEMSRIIINIDEMINNNVIQVPINTNKSDFIYELIINNKLDIIIHRPITTNINVKVNLNELQINKFKLKQKLINLFN